MKKIPSCQQLHPLATSLAVALTFIACLWLYKAATSDSQPIDTPGITVLSSPNAMPHFDLTDDHGQRFDREKLLGNWTMIAFGYASCPDFCPITLADMNRVFTHLDAWPQAARGSRFVFISVDPHRDTPEQLSSYVAYFNPGFTGVTGTPAELRRLTDELGIHYEYEDTASGLLIRDVVNTPDSGEYIVHHYAGLLLIDPQARLVGSILPPFDPERVIPTYFDIRNRYGDPAS